MKTYDDLKQLAWECNRELPARSLVTYTFGNASAFDRDRGVFAIKPSGVPFQELKPDTMVVVDLDSRTVEGDLKPSSDTKTHALLYQHWPDISGIVHTHSLYAAAWAQAMRPIPVLGTTHADYLAQDIPCTDVMSDDMIKAICARDGVIGAVFAEQMLSPCWNWDDPSTHYTNATRPMAAVVEHIDHICQLAGNCSHVAFGTDLDGGFGLELSPTDYNTIDDLQEFLSILADRGYTQEDVAGFAHGNLLRFFGEAWRKA